MSEEFVHRVYVGSYQRLVGQLFAVCGDLAEAEDLVQEAFARAVQHSHRFARTDNPEAWLRTVAVNLVRSRWRRQLLGHRVHRMSASGRERDVPDLSTDHVTLMSAMTQLPRAQREAIALHHLADLSVEEVARTVGAPVGTVKARLSRGRATLARILTDPPPAARPHPATDTAKGVSACVTSTISSTPTWPALHAAAHPARLRVGTSSGSSSAARRVERDRRCLRQRSGGCRHGVEPDRLHHRHRSTRRGGPAPVNRPRLPPTGPSCGRSGSSTIPTHRWWTSASRRATPTYAPVCGCCAPQTGVATRPTQSP